MATRPRRAVSRSGVLAAVRPRAGNCPRDAVEPTPWGNQSPHAVHPGGVTRLTTTADPLAAHLPPAPIRLMAIE